MVTSVGCAVLAALLGVVSSQQPTLLGCGGFLKPPTPAVTITYSRVLLQLFTKQGSLKYQTDCAPNNGYYFIPLYDKGDYVLKVSPPDGWSFEPNSVPLHIDGNDPCSLSKDINFHFKGFSIRGQVLSLGTDSGPSGVRVVLKSGNSETRETLTTSNGHYEFNEIVPGDYQLSASHAVWKFKRSSTTVKVSNDNAGPSEPLQIAGYDVRGTVTSEKEPVKGVHFVAFSKESKIGGLVGGCTPSLPAGFDMKRSPADHTAVCYVTSDAEGAFIFPSLVPGDYVLVPFYHGQNIQFDVSPTNYPFQLKHQSLQLDAAFQVKGFSVTGRVLAGINTDGVDNAKVFVNGELRTKTGKEGLYFLDSMKPGYYNVLVTSDRMTFDEVKVHVTPNSPLLPDIVASAFDICGRVITHSLRPHDSSRHFITVTSTADSATDTAEVNASGKFCVHLKRGQYKLSVRTERTSGLQFKPQSVSVQVENSPDNVVFEQVLLTVKGKVKCLEPCKNVQVSLRDGLDSSNAPAKVSSVENNAFQFERVHPGTYAVTVIRDDWCWKDTSITVTVTEDNTHITELQHTGYVLTLMSSHSTKLSYSLVDDKKSNKSSPLKHLAIEKGTNRVCLDEKGTYRLVPEDCHLFSVDRTNNVAQPIEYSTLKPTVLSLAAVRHRLSGVITADLAAEDTVITVATHSPQKEPVKEILKLTQTASSLAPFSYTFSTWVSPDQEITIVPTSGKLLFHPVSANFTTLNDCMEKIIEFHGKKGLFLTGKVSPPLEKVKIRVTSVDDSIEPITLETSADGQYKVGPLHSGIEYKIHAEKQGYVLSEVDKNGNLVAFKLAEVGVEVLNEENEPLPSVVVSLSGGEGYRRNSLTQNDGKMLFSGLSPGQYFLRPMMKEFHFEPASKIIDVVEGASVNIKLRGKRVAFSCFGRVLSLNGEPESGIVVEAVGVGDCAPSQEEATSESDGSYHIRGLRPGCSHHIQLKRSPDINQHIERSIPSFRTVAVNQGDTLDVNLILLRPFGVSEVSGLIDAETQFYPTLQVRLSADNNVDDPVAVSDVVGPGAFFFPALPMNDQRYVISVITTLSRKEYDYQLPEAVFRANDTYHYIRMAFNARVRLAESETTRGSYIALPIVVVVIFLFYNYMRLLPAVLETGDLLQFLLQRKPAAQSSTTNIPTYGISHATRANTDTSTGRGSPVVSTVSAELPDNYPSDVLQDGEELQVGDSAGTEEQYDTERLTPSHSLPIRRKVKPRKL